VMPLAVHAVTRGRGPRSASSVERSIRDFLQSVFGMPVDCVGVDRRPCEEAAGVRPITLR